VSKAVRGSAPVFSKEHRLLLLLVAWSLQGYWLKGSSPRRVSNYFPQLTIPCRAEGSNHHLPDLRRPDHSHLPVLACFPLRRSHRAFHLKKPFVATLVLRSPRQLETGDLPSPSNP